MKSFILSLCVLLTIITGCSNSSEQFDSSTSWAYYFVLLNDTIYIQTSEQVENVNQQLGTIQKSSNDERTQMNTNQTFSNYLPKGTKLYSIPGKNHDEYIAVRNKDGNYDVLKSQGKYGSSSSNLISATIINLKESILISKKRRLIT
ncbi:hypothetical protein [Cohnella abietis]|uniref:Lipoprotein n=1 Tax=Cohnella abietis TaxID=2507935 RepID=A0A3T1D206_9BACL|nr:hypothetical protein [Cohnella abietis]BBI32114.1 hypothetical protein KCTCHS21_15130 [Cohnella abietis]